MGVTFFSYFIVFSNFKNYLFEKYYKIMDITINGKNVTLKKTFRSVITYEQAMGKSFNPQTITETVMYFYCVVIASDQSVEITFDEFLNWLDDNPTAIKDFTDWLIKQAEIESKLAKKKSTKAK